MVIYTQQAGAFFLDLLCMLKIAVNGKRTLLMLLFSFAFANLFSQNFCSSDRFINPSFFSDDQLKTETNLYYGIATDWKGVQDTQHFYIVYPDVKIDELKKRPFVMLMHGGGFAPETDFSRKEQWIPLCRLLAKRGFVAATIDYRVGWDDRHKTWKEYTPEERKNPTGLNAIYRAYQDARAALRYFVHNAALFGIDTNNIFVGGRSAGGELSIACAFYSQKNVDSVLNTVIRDNYPEKFGPLDSSTNAFTEKYSIRGVANMWGPVYDTTLISKEEAEAIPIIMFHGTDDKLVPYKNWDTTMFPFEVYGSYCIARRYQNLGCCYQLNTKIDGGHGEDFSNEFLAEHMAAFFKDVMCKRCKSQEFESEVSFGWKLKVFFESGAWLNLLPVAIILVLIALVFRYIRKRRAK